ncbi:MAG: CBS domain-containing protein [Candidatus Bathyarchaeota archaeon]|nr:CBS domain-containing protein [Candidatus Bathyarchaeota archaeon]
MESFLNFEVDKIQTSYITVSPSTSISKVVGIFNSHNVYEVFTVIDGKVYGITAKNVLSTLNPEAKLSSVATLVPTVTSKTKIYDVVELMLKHKLHSLPVFENKKLVGIVDASTIVSQATSLKKTVLNYTADDVMARSFPVIYENDLAARARSLIIKNGIDYLPVISSTNKAFYGILTSIKLASIITPSGSPTLGIRGFESLRKMDFPVKDLVETNVLMFNVDEKLHSIVDGMLTYEKDYAVITLWDEFQGIVDFCSILKLIAKTREPEFPVYIVGLPEDAFEAEAAKTKFIRVVNTAKKVFPYIEEASSVIKTTRMGGERRRYEVNVTIKTPKKVFKFSESGWDLPSIYDLISGKIKRIVSKRSSKIKRRLKG